MLATQAMDLALLVQRSTRRLATPTRLAIACAARVVEGGGPFTVRPPNFRAMDEAHAAEGQ